jgi:hypothetical protein
MEVEAARAWSFEEFGSAALGDARRTARLVAMGRRTAERPSGRISEVFDSDAERQGAYDFLEGSAVSAAAIGAAVAEAAVRRARDTDQVVVAIDGSSLSLVNHAGTKDFGRIGSYRGSSLDKPGNGLKVISSLAIGPAGTPVGLVDQQCANQSSGMHRHASETDRPSLQSSMANRGFSSDLETRPMRCRGDAAAKRCCGAKMGYRASSRGCAYRTPQAPCSYAAR